MAPPVHRTTRQTRRLQTRERILGAAIAEFARCGMAAAEISHIVTAAGVAHGTFYFHFPSKEHVVLELERREEARIAAELERVLARPHTLEDTLTEVVRLLVDLEHRFGGMLFKEILALHFSPARSDDWTDHPVIVLLVREIEHARGDGLVHPEVDTFYSAVFFLLGIYGVLCATGDTEGRDAMTSTLIATAVRGLQIR